MECGTPIQFEEFGFSSTCPKCGAAHRLPRDASGVWIATYSYNLDIIQATGAATALICRKLGGARKADFDIIERYPLYLPVWKFTARAQGWFIAKDGRTLPLDIEKHVRVPGYDTSYIGFPEFHEGTHAVISSETCFPSLQVKLKPDVLEQKTEELMQKEVEHATGGSAGRIKYTAEEPVLCLHPAWVMRFRTKNGEHTLVLDGLTGAEINHLDIRLRDEKQLAETVLAVSCGIIAASGVAIGAASGWHGLAVGLIVSGIGLFVAVNALRFILRAEHSRPRAKAGRAGA